MNEDDVDNETEIIESKAVIVDEKINPVIVKKGSFPSFLAFVFATSALALSGYQYYLQTNVNKKDNSQEWQAPLKLIETKVQQQASRLEASVMSLKTDSQALNKQLQVLQTSINTAQPNKQNNPKTPVFDDSKLNLQLSQIQTELNEQKKQFQQLNKPDQQQIPKNIIVQNNSSKQAIPLGLVEVQLLAAHKSLNVLGDVSNTQVALQQAITQLEKLSEPKYVELINSLTSVSNELNADKKVDIFGLNKEIDALEFNSKTLQFASNEETHKQEGVPWYDKLVKIKKIDDSQKTLLTQSEQSSVRQTLKIHFDLLKMALISQNQESWASEITQLQDLLMQYFGENASASVSQLDTLKFKNINPDLPSLAPYLQQFQLLTSSKQISE